MELSPVQLIEAHLVKVSVEHNAEYADEEGAEIALDHMSHIECSSEELSHDSNPSDQSGSRNYRLVFGLRSNAEKQRKMPYQFEIIITALITVREDAVDDDDALNNMAMKYGYTMVYGQIRERLLNLTSRMQHGAFMLPTMNFMDEMFPIPVQGKLDPQSD